MVGEDTQSSSGASGLGGRGRAARVGRIVTLGPRRIALPGFIAHWRRARVYLKMILGIHRSHVY
jgi:hypothetical protein